MYNIKNSNTLDQEEEEEEGGQGELHLRLPLSRHGGEEEPGLGTESNRRNVITVL